MERFNDAREALIAAEQALADRIDNNAKKMQDTKLTLEACESTDAQLKQRLEDTQLAIRMVESEREHPIPGQALPDEANVPETPTEPVAPKYSRGTPRFNPEAVALSDTREDAF